MGELMESNAFFPAILDQLQAIRNGLTLANILLAWVLIRLWTK